MIAKSKAPMWSRAQRRHPKRTLAAMMPKGSAPSPLLQRLLVLNGYWPENPEPQVVAATPIAPKAEQPGLLSKIKAKVGRWFGR